MNYATSVKALAEIGYDDWLVMETPGGPHELIARDISFTRFWFPQLKKPQWPRLGAFSYDFKRGELSKLIDGFKSNGLTAHVLG